MLMGMAMSSRSVNISWQPPEIYGRLILDYRVTITPLYRNSEPLHNATMSLSIVIDGLYPATFYLCTVAARTSTDLQHPTSTLIELPPDGKDHLACKCC